MKHAKACPIVEGSLTPSLQQKFRCKQNVSNLSNVSLQRHYSLPVVMCANKQVVTFIKYSLGKSPLLRIVQKKNRPEKIPFIATNRWIVIALS